MTGPSEPTPTPWRNFSLSRNRFLFELLMIFAAVTSGYCLATARESDENEKLRTRATEARTVALETINMLILSGGHISADQAGCSIVSRQGAFVRMSTAACAEITGLNYEVKP